MLDFLDRFALLRLERNRASARVRRQRKKSMAELYEKEVARLERCANESRRVICHMSSVICHMCVCVNVFLRT